MNDEHRTISKWLNEETAYTPKLEIINMLTETEQLRAELAAAQELINERNMISDLITEDSTILFDCLMSYHDAHSFWSFVRDAHEHLKKED